MNHLPVPTTANVPPTPTSVASKDTNQGMESNLRRIETAHQPMHFLTPPNKTPSSSIKKNDPKTAVIKKLIPDYENPMYDELRQAVTSILAVSSKFELKSSRIKGVVLVCGEASASAEETGFGVNIIPLLVRGAGPGVFYETNSLILVLGKYASENDPSQGPVKDEELPELILGLCCNNWGMFNGRNALIEALLEILGPEHRSKLMIHSAIYALEFNTAALRQIIDPSEQEAVMGDNEHGTRTLHANAFAASAKKYGLAFDSLEDRQIDGVSKEAFVEELSQATISAVERTLSSTTGRRAIGMVLEILELRRLIQDNLTNKRFRRARSQNGIEDASCKLRKVMEAHFQSPTLDTAERLAGWDAYTKAQGGAASAVLGLVCHSIDVLAGCVARSPAKITPDLAERLVLTVLAQENRLMEYTFNQVYELMPSQPQDQEQSTGSSMYIYRRPGDLLLFSNMPCGVVEMGGKL